MSWEDQSDELQTFAVRHGRPFNLDRCEAGTGNFMFKNGDGALDPANSNSPYYPDILPLKEIWFSRREDGVTYNRFRGPIERYKPVWQPPSHQAIGIDAADAFETLANIQLLSGTASLTTALTGSNNDLVFTARNAGGQGDDITVEYVVAGNDTDLDAGTNDPVDGGATFPSSRDAALAAITAIFARTVTPAAPVGLTVQGTDIIVTVATNGAGAPTSTSALIKTALEANADVMALVSIAHAPSNSGAGVVTAMAKTNLSGGKWVTETSGARITRVLDFAAWPADKRAVDDGTFEVISQGFGEADNVTALTHMQDVADSELGYCFIDGDGNFVFHDGAHRSRETRSTTSQATFSDDGTGYPYYALELTFDKDRIWNEVTVTAGGEGAIPQVVEDVDSQLAYSPFPGTPIPRTLSKATLLAHDSDALLVADAILDVYKDPHTRFESISLYMPSDSASWSPAVLGREIGDLVTVRTSPPVSPARTTNLVANGGFETNTTGWSDGSAAITRVTTQATYGVASGQIVAPGGAPNEFVSYPLTGLSIGVSHIASVSIKGPVGARLYVNLFDGTDSALTDHVCSGAWERVVTPVQVVSATTATLYVATDTAGPAQAITFWIDGAQVEANTTATPYVETDGAIKTYPSAYTIAYDCFVESIADAGSPGVPWSVTFQLTPVSEALSGPPGGGGLGALVDSTGDTFTLDSATLGVLG